MSTSHSTCAADVLGEPKDSYAFRSRRERRARGRRAPGDAAVLRNPWSCAIVYRDGVRAHYEVTVEPDGHYVGRGTGIIDGCCVQTPAIG
ncbi:MAG TPA: hypothetical protein VIJ66_04335 [Solirubrobacteraceae bacterium]